MSSSPGGFNGVKMKEQEDEARDLAAMTVKCALCDWPGHTGTAGECRLEAEKHRRRKHPKIRGTRRRGRGHHLLKFRQPDMDDEERALIEYERQKRAKLTGVDLTGQSSV